MDNEDEYIEECIVTDYKPPTLELHRAEAEAFYNKLFVKTFSDVINDNKVNVQMQIIQRVISLSVERVFCEAGFSEQDAQRFIFGELLLSPIELDKIADVLGVHKKLLLEKQKNDHS